MPSKIQRLASGYLDLLGIHGTGRTPADASDFVQPTVDMRDFYGSRILESVDAVAAVNAVGSVVTIEVPQAELWRVRCVHCRMSGLTAAQVILIAVSIRVTATGARLRVLSPPEQTVITTGDEITSTTGLIEPIIIAPGTQIQGRVRHPIGAAVTMGVGVLFERLRI